ncbi:zinc finger protein 724-like [Spodoptera litura]|uniref:Zinc finger protein 724-like n=1 Tax=Spodoptera litura TaxID=69820 RepID=A0A9J7ISD8_SPOLT|nr:zinc finger protein 724-like [Spodoptera litura]
MDEKNPLQISKTPSQVPGSKEVNKRGRPAVKNIVMFGPQPRSIMAQMLSEAKKSKTIVTEDKPVIQSEQETSQDVVEIIVSCDPIEEHRSFNIDDDTKHQTSNQKLECDYPNCGYSCKLSSNLIKHKRVHTNEKPYLCDRCSFRTNFVNSLKAHKRIHTAERPYQCEYCPYKCNSSSNLKKHCLLKHSEGDKSNEK